MKHLPKIIMMAAMLLVGVIVSPLFAIFPKEETHEG